MKKNILFFLVIGLCALIACQKEVNFETNQPSKGSLQDDASSNCLPKTVNGVYKAGTVLSIGSNTISVSVNVSQPGTYTISTDTINGYSFRSTGTFNVPGTATVIIRGSGTPIAPGTNNFVVKYDTSYCDVAVTVEAGTTNPAVYTLAGAGGTCTGAVVAGTYATGTPLNTTNTVTLGVNVTGLGSYSLTTSFQGMTFAGSGNFTALGANTVVLTGTGTPTTAGANTVPIAVGAGTCSFAVTVGSPANYTMNCGSAVINGTYQAGTALSASNTVVIPVNVTTPGIYSFSTATINGMTFAGSGNLAAGPGTITLTGSGTPAAAGTFTFGGSCSFNIVVGAAAVVTWKFTQGANTYQGTTVNANMQNVGGFLGFYFTGDNVAGDDFIFSLGDTSGTIEGNEIYSTATSTSNSAIFQFLPSSGTDTWNANPTTTGATISFTISFMNYVTKTISGTFSGNARNGAGTILPITAGWFLVTYL